MIRTESFWAVVKVRSPHPGPGIRYIIYPPRSGIRGCSARDADRPPARSRLEARGTSCCTPRTAGPASSRPCHTRLKLGRSPRLSPLGVGAAPAPLAHRDENQWRADARAQQPPYDPLRGVRLMGEPSLGLAAELQHQQVRVRQFVMAGEEARLKRVCDPAVGCRIYGARRRWGRSSLS